MGASLVLALALTNRQLNLQRLIARDTGLEIANLMNAMENSDYWKVVEGLHRLRPQDDVYTMP